MSTNTKKPFNKRKFVVLMAVICGTGLLPTGLVNHYLQAEPLMAQRHAWMAAHWALGIMFVVFAGWHAILNQKALINYVRALVPGREMISRETVWAAVVVVLVLCIAVGHTFHVH